MSRARSVYPPFPVPLPSLALVLAGLLLAASACTRFAPLEADKIDRISLRLGGGGAAVCVNDPRSHVVVDLIQSDGTRLETWNGQGSRDGKVSLGDLAISADGVAVDQLGRIRFPHDRLGGLDRRVTVRARLRDRPIEDSIVLTPRFDCGGVADYSGAPGATGGDGAGGSSGEAGPDLRVALARIDTRLNGRLLVVRVTRPGAPPEYHMVATRGPTGRFAVAAAGGPGGHGGQGERGAYGIAGNNGSNGFAGAQCADGTDAVDGGDGQPGGAGGQGGDGGDGGSGGLLVIEYAPGSAVLVDQLAFRVDGGAAGVGGPGGEGGRGGSGGRGGQGGQPGRAQDGSGNPCKTRRGQDGTNGVQGPPGATGSDGSDGRPGTKGAVQARAVDASQLWARELSEGAAIVIDPLEH